MQVRPLSIEGAWEFTIDVFPDDRGCFTAPFHENHFRAAVGHPLTIRQTNLSPTRAGAVRGVHFADLPPSQAKYVTAAAGRILDVVVDVRVGSPTFGAFEAIELVAPGIDGHTTTDHPHPTAIYLSEGLGHLVVGLEDHSAVSYLCSASYAPQREHGVTPTDPDLGLPLTDWADGSPILSTKDAAAPTLADAARQGLLPRYDDCLAYRATMRALSKHT